MLIVTGTVANDRRSGEPRIEPRRCDRCGMKMRDYHHAARYCSAVCRDRHNLYKRMGIV